MLSPQERVQTAVHESGHVLGFLLAGLPIEKVVVDDDEDPQVLGRVCIAWEQTERMPDFEYLIGLLMGPRAHGRQLPDFDALSIKRPGRDYGDDFQIAIMVRLLRLDRGGYRAAIAFADHLLAQPDVRRARDLLARALVDVPQLSGEEIEELLGDELMAQLRPKELS
jgi:hypothetical protein